MQSRPAHYNTRYKHDLTPRQTAVLDLMAEGRTNAEIAERLGLTLDGAKWHVREILGKLGMESREDAVAWWRRYRRMPSRAGRRMFAFLALPIWKPAAIAGAALGVVTVGAGVVFALRGGLGAEAGANDPPACRAENLRWQITPGAGPGSFGVAISLRDADWYEGIFKTLHVSDRKVDSPCTLDTTASVSVVGLHPLPDWPDDKQPAPLVGSEKVATDPAGPLSAPVQAKLISGQAAAILTVTVANWCFEGRGTHGANVNLADMFDAKSSQGMTVPFETLPACEDPAQPPSLHITTP